MTNQTTRVLDLLKRFNQNKKVCISQLQDELLWEGKSEKTIRRDLDVIKEIFPESFELVRGGENGCYKAITKEAFNNFIDNPNTLSLMVQTFSITQHSDLFNNLEMDETDKRLIENKIKDMKKIYEFKSKPFENKSGKAEIFKIFEHAIYHKKETTIFYGEKGYEQEFSIRPYKILFMNENFYIATEVLNRSFKFSMFRVSKILTAQYSNKTFHHNRDITSFIKQMQTPNAKYTPEYREHLIEVIVEVDKRKAKHFKAKKHLLSQKIIEEREDGTLILSYEVTQEMEMHEIIKKWLPYVKVISPNSLKESIEKDLREYLK